MPQQFSDNAICLLSASLTDTATSMAMETGAGDQFPEAGATSPSGSDWFKVVLTDETGEIEIVYVNTRTSGSDVFSACVRGREGTAARAWSSGAVVKLAMTAKDLQNGLLVIPSGTRMLFQQSAAPVGWTKDTTHNNKALRVVSGSVVNGGTVDFTAAFAPRVVSGTVGSTTLTLTQIPSHSHPLYQNAASGSTQVFNEASMYLNFGTSLQTTRTWNDRLANAGGEVIAQAVGGGGGHTHTFTGGSIDLNVKYVDFIIATKD